MIAYHGNESLKSAVLSGIVEHERLDQIASGSYYEKSGDTLRMCAVGCTLETLRRIKRLPQIQHGSHVLYERYLGVPEVLARLEDGISEGLPAEERTTWPRRFAEAIPVGADLSMVWPRFALDLLTAPDGAIQQRVAQYPAMGPSIAGVAALYQRWVDGEKPSRDEWIAARMASDDDAAAYAYASDDADAAAYAYAYAYAAYASDDAGWRERHRQADVLLRLLRESR